MVLALLRPASARSSARVALAAALLSPAAARAVPLLELVGSPTPHEGWCAPVLARGAAATYFNPALLPGLAPGVSLGTWTLGEALSISREARPAGFDVTDAVYDARVVTATGTERPVTRPLPTARLPTAAPDEDAFRTYLVLGGVLPVIDG